MKVASLQFRQSFQTYLHSIFAVRVAIIFVFLGRSISFVDSSSHYTDSWAVEVRGGREAADRLAKEHGFLNVGEVGKLKDIYHFALDDSTGSWGAAGKRDTRSIHAVQLREDKMRTIALQREPNVGYVMQQQLLQLEKKQYRPPQDPKWGAQWSLHNVGQTSGPAGLDLNVEPAWIQGITGTGVVVTVVDDGLEASHPDLQINFDSQASRDFIEHDEDPTPDGASYHGTACAGIIGMARNGICGVGVAPGTSLGGLRLDLGYMFDITQAGILSYHDDYVDVYSNSWGPMETGFFVGGPGYLTRQTLERETQQGRHMKGSIYVFASGNGGGFHDSCAADGYVNSIYTIAVGSADQNGEQAYYDEDCSAKMAVTFSHNSDTTTSSANIHNFTSNQLYTTSLNGQCSDTFTGTSASAPLMAGAVSLTLEANSNLTWRDVQYLIVYTSNPDILTVDDLATNGAGLRFSHHFGFGAIDAEAMVTRARHWINVPEQISQTFSSNSMHIVGPLDSVVMEFSVDNSRWSYETIRYLEHVVLTITLEVEGYEQEYNVDDFFTYRESVGNDTAELVAWLTDAHPRRGDVKIELTSPQNTTSTLLPYREYDFVNSEGYENWPFMTVHNWGEDPNGTWTVKITYKSASGYVRVGGVGLTLYGTASTPESVRAIPSQCDKACSRGCWGEGPSKCDVCKQLRLNSTLECVEVCPPGYTEYHSYCLCENCDLGDFGESNDSSDNTRDGERGSNATESGAESSDDGSKPDSETEREGSSESVHWNLSVILSSVAAALILVILVIVCYFAFGIARQSYHRKMQMSFTRLQEHVASV